MLTQAELTDFEDEVGRAFDAGGIRGPIHLNSPSQVASLITIFKEVKRTDWVLSTWRAHWHALLHGVPRERVMAEILAGRSMMLHFPEHHFMSSAIVGGMLPIACGLAAAGERVWCFVGDMCAMGGGFHEAMQYARRNLGGRLNFVVEDNELSTNTPTQEAWGSQNVEPSRYQYHYKRTTQHYGTHGFVSF